MSIESELVEIQSLIHGGTNLDVPQQRLIQLINDVNMEDLQALEVQIRLVAAGFQQKRNKNSIGVLEARLGTHDTGQHDFAPQPHAEHEPLDVPMARLDNELQRMSDRFLFKWDFYRQHISPLWNSLLEREDAGKTWMRMSDSIQRHANEIFLKGYEFKVNQENFPHPRAVWKALSGISGMITLTMDFYMQEAGKFPGAVRARRLQGLTSSILKGILVGFGSTNFGHESGWAVLAEHADQWVECLAFLTDEDLREFAGEATLYPCYGEFVQAFEPLLLAIGKLMESYGQGEMVPMPVRSFFNPDGWAVVAFIRPCADSPAQDLIRLTSFLRSDALPMEKLTSWNLNGAVAILAPWSLEREAWLAQHPEAAHVHLTRPTRRDEVPAVYRGVLDALREALAEGYREVTDRTPLQSNPAKLFPLRAQRLDPHYHVNRSSVGELMRTFAHHSGVRLWCSVRRSGKSTSRYDLERMASQATIVTQTCQELGKATDDSQFIKEVGAAIQAGVPIGDDFFYRKVQDCAPPYSQGSGRFVFILDEYESLFSLLKWALRKDEDLRYTVVQPLLNQMAGFSDEHLLVFLGLRPDAFYMMEDQNPLSHRIKQDAFPLFSHFPGDREGELGDLAARVLGSQIDFGTEFLDELAAETAGHPYLTVNLLVDFVDWLIEKRRPAKHLFLRGEDMQVFRRERLTLRLLARTSAYDYFLNTIGSLLAPRVHREERWASAVYGCLRGIMRDAPDRRGLSMQDFEAMYDRMGFQAMTGLSADRMIVGGALSNFFKVDRDLVSPGILLLGRLCEAATPGVMA